MVVEHAKVLAGQGSDRSQELWTAVTAALYTRTQYSGASVGRTAREGIAQARLRQHGSRPRVARSRPTKARFRPESA